MKLFKLFILLFFCSILLGTFSSCEGKTETLEIDYGYEYFPTEIGHSITYQVDSTFYDLFGDTVFTHSVQIKETIIEESNDNEGRPVFHVARYSRKDASVSWDNVIPRIWYAVKSETEGERVEENLRFLKLTFPIREGNKWAGNAYINTEDERWGSFADWLYEYTEVGMPATVNGQSFDKTITVIQNDYCNLQQSIFGKEIYAENVGLIYKEYMDLKLQASSLPPKETNPWPDRANDGLHIVWQVLEVE